MSWSFIPVLYITDCDDTNSRIRFAARIASLFGCQPEIIGLTGDHHGNHKDCEAAGQLVDTIAALDGASAIIITNHAPRNGEYKEENGAPFCFFWVKATLVITTIGGHILSLVKKLHLAETITVLHLDATVRLMQNHGAVNADDAKELLITQFRSLLFAPLAAKSLHEGRIRSGECLPLSKVPDIPPHTIWFVDAFGNRKLTTTWEEVGWKEGDHIATDISQASIPFIERLTDVPVGTIAFTVGSSGGRGKKHFIELVMNGGDPAVYLGHPLEIGKTITAQAMKKKEKEGTNGDSERNKRRTVGTC